MISLSLIDSLLERLNAYVSRAAALVQYGPRDGGNYSPDSFARQLELLGRHDPTGFASSMLLDEAIEGVITSATLRLDRVLRQEGFLDRIAELPAIQRELALVLDAPRAAFMERVTASLLEVNPALARPSTREVAVCLRDAVHAIDGGLTMRWLRCETPGTPAHEAEQDGAPLRLPLSSQVQHHASLPDFLDALMATLPFGAHLACIGGDDTVIGLKQPGRVVYLSTLALNVHDGKLRETRRDYSAAAFDLNRPLERYPNWRATAGSSGALSSMSEPVPARRDRAPTILQLADLAPDRLIWLALVVELSRQVMDRTEPGSVALAETMTRALATASCNLLPAVQANYALATPTIDELFDAFAFNDWTANFLRPALAGLSPELLLPVAERAFDLHLDTLQLAPHQTDNDMWNADRDAYRAVRVRIVAVSAHLAGTRAEIEQLRNAILTRNLGKYLMAWGNRRVAMLWLDGTAKWFKQALEKNLRSALASSSCTLGTPDSDYSSMLHFYSQSAKHKTYNARCWFEPKRMPTHLATIQIDSSAALVETLGLASEADVPEWLRGWVRTPDDGRTASVFGIRREWAWNDLNNGCVREQVMRHGGLADFGRFDVRRRGFLRACVSLNEHSVPELFRRAAA